MSSLYVPSSSGDFRLESDGPTRSRLTVEDPTPLERDKLAAFLAAGVAAGWAEKSDLVRPDGRSEIRLGSPISTTGKVLIPKAYPDKGVLTVVKSAAGKITCVTENVVEALDALAVLDSATGEPVPAVEERAVPARARPPKPPAPEPAAVAARRPTSCCPDNVEGPLKRSSRVLREFCTPSQWKSWVENGYLLCRGGLTGYVYRLAHRHHPLAIEQGKMGYDLTNGHRMHFWNWSVPPAEEVLGAKLILEHREPWLRNQSTCLGGRPGETLFPNPLGSDGGAGTWDAGMHSSFLGLMPYGIQDFWADLIGPAPA